VDYRRLFRIRSGRDALRRELDDEIQTHIELRTEELIGQGFDPDAARAEAARRFGDLETARRALYDSARQRERRLERSQWAEEVRRDVRLAVRRLVRAPGYATVSIGILAVGIALTTSMFAIVDSTLLRPLPFPEAERLVALHSVGEAGEPFAQVSMGNWIDWREIDGIAATGLYRPDRQPVTLGEDAFRVDAALVAGDFFDVFRPAMVAGRYFTSDEGQDGAALLVVSSAFAVQRFGGPGAALARSLTVGSRSYEIVGVVEDEQVFPEGTEVWIPLSFRPESGRMRNNINFESVARIAASSSLDQLQARATATAQGIMASDPEALYSHDLAVLPLSDVLAAESRRTLIMLMVAVAGVLLAACANLAGLGLARMRRRAPEVALRLALGSGRVRLARALIVEYVVLALAGGLVGLALTSLVDRLLFARLGAIVPRSDAIALDYRAGLFALAVSLLAGIVAGVLPALHATRGGGGGGAGRRTRTGMRGAVTGGKGLPGGLLVSAEVALALMLLIGGGLLTRSFLAVVDRDLGYDPTGVVTAEVVLSTPEYRDAERAVEYWVTLLAAFEEIPGVTSTAAGTWIPTGGGGTSFLTFPENPDPDFGGGYRVVSEKYFEALDIGVVAGRVFDDRDGAGTERVTLVNQSLADRAWPGENPIGRRVSPVSMEEWMYDGDPPWLTVIGVVDDVRHFGYEAEARPELFVLYRQVPSWATSMTAVVRSTGVSVDRIASAVRDVARSIDPALAVETGSLDQRLHGLLEDRVVTLRVLLGFALSGIFLMCFGVYGLVAYAASLRTREIAIRAALGARRSGLLSLMLWSAVRVILVGTVAGVAASYFLSGLLESLLVDVPTTDPLTYLLAALTLGAVGLLAALLPSVRAARMDPMEALTSS